MSKIKPLYLPVGATGVVLDKKVKCVVGIPHYTSEGSLIADCEYCDYQGNDRFCRRTPCVAADREDNQDVYFQFVHDDE